MNCDILIVGAGFSGLTIAQKQAVNNKKIIIVEKRDHIGGNCYDYIDKGIIVQKYGPHIFHTKDKEVFDYISKFTKWNDYKHKVIALYNKKYYPIPINRTTINLFYNTNFKTEEEVKIFLETKREKIEHIKNSKDVVESKFGKELYEAFVKEYTKKQWDLFPEELEKTVLERLPIRYDDNPYYFNDAYQGMPIGGFTPIFEKMTENKNIQILLNTDFFKIRNNINAKIIVFTGRIDHFFNYKYGKLDYRCINFVFENKEIENFQPNSVVNYTEKGDFTRITEFKKFYNIKSKENILCTEYPSWEGEPTYPVMNEKNITMLQKYLNDASQLKNVYFLGRLGQYKYLDIDKAIKEALILSDKISAIKE